MKFLYFMIILIQSVLHLNHVNCSCPLEEDITNIARCIQVDVTAIIYAVRGREDLTSFCQLADRYMECFKTYTRGCVGFHFAEGTLTELQNIALYCCQGIFANPDCPLNTNVRKCIDGNAYATLSDGSKTLISSLQVGDKVKTLDSNGNLVDTVVIMLLDKSSKKSLFFNIKTYSNVSLSVSGSHLMAIPDGKFKYAKRLFRDDMIITYDQKLKKQVEDKIESIMIEEIEGYAAPLTMAGTILVNNMLASCYAVVDSHNLAHTVMAPVRWWHFLNNFLFFNENDRNTSENLIIPWYPKFLMSITDLVINKFIKLY